MKKLFIFAVAALAMIGCTKKDNLSLQNVAENTNGVIALGSMQEKMTKAFEGSDAAEKLNNNFIVYGFKYTGSEDLTTSSNDKKVFDLYNVNYIDGSAFTTESNTAGWEYVGLNSHPGSSNTSTQTIKYWDYATDAYVFSAVSGIGVTATKTLTGATKYDKGWTVTIPAGGDLSNLYASNRVVANKDNGANPSDYNQTVKLTFYNLATKIRFAMYETVPGYEVHVDKFYYDESETATPSWQNTTTNFAIGGQFRTANATTTTPLTVTYYDGTNGVENRPKVSYAAGAANESVFGIFGANIQAEEKLGTTSSLATYDQADKSYTMILPYAAAGMTLYVDYTLKSTDGSNETIEVKHASAKVPANFTNWKENFAYTYIFKISDNTNGTTGNPGNPDDPTSTPTDPTGLFPITFDACVIDAEDGIQETITSVAATSITTYQKGKVVTENDEYVASDDIYFEDGAANVAGYKVFEVNNYGTEATTEQVIANYLNNFCVLTEVDVTFAPGTGTDGVDPDDFIPLSDLTYIKKSKNQAAKFTPAAGKTYVIVPDIDAWDPAVPATAQCKVVKVAGSATAPSFTLAQTDGSNPITTVAGKTVLTLKQGTVGVIGAKPNFKITSTGGNKGLVITPTATAGVYDVTVAPAAIYAGKANDTYTVDFKGETVVITVNIANALSATAVTVTAGNATGATTTFTIASALSDDGVIVNENKGINIVPQGAGVYKVTADADVAYKAAGYDATIGGVALKINVDSYAFLSDVVLTIPNTGAMPTADLTLQKNGGAATGVTTLTGANPSIATFTAADGVYTFTAVAGGSFDVTYENAKAKVTVNAYTIATPASIKKSTGVANIEVKCNGTTINASTASLVNTSKPDVKYTTYTEYNAATGATLADQDEFDALDEALKVKTPAVYTVTTNGQVIKFSGASQAGNYEFDYKVGTTVVAHVTVTVVD